VFQGVTAIFAGFSLQSRYNDLEGLGAIMSSAKSNARVPTSKAASRRWFLVVVCCAVGAVAVFQHIARRRQAPDYKQQIYATLVSWGVSLDGMALPVSREEIDRHVTLLWSDIGHQRVQAAAWLARRGVRQAGPDIAASMKDERTHRPCQLAHSLGRLGDDRWVESLAEATGHPKNADLRMCATIALGKLGSPKAVGGLIDAHRRKAVGNSAIMALGNIADPLALPYLRSVVRAPGGEFERRSAAEAIERITLMQHAKSATLLIDRVRRSSQRGRLDRWAVRKLVGLGDPRAAEVFQHAFLMGSFNEAELVILAAAMLSHGGECLSAIEDVAFGLPHSASNRSEVARAAWALAETRVSLHVRPAQSPSQARK
jgi:hypothetical protein